MGQNVWDFPKTEEGLRECMLRLQACHEAGDLLGVGNGLLALSSLVKSVRSDTKQPQAVRAHELRLLALEAFRESQDPKGLVRALIAASDGTSAQTHEPMLREAEQIVERIDDEELSALVLAAKARTSAAANRELATAMLKEAMDVFRRTENKPEMARTLFSLSISQVSTEQKIDFAIESFRLYRALGRQVEAVRSLNIALMNAERIQSPNDLEPLLREGLADVLEVGSQELKKTFYEKLARAAESKGELETARQFRELKDKIHFVEDREATVLSAKRKLATAIEFEDEEMVRILQNELDRLQTK